MDSKTASDQLNRVLSFFPRVDSKSSALFAIDSTMIGVLASRVNVADMARWPIVGSSALAFGCLAYAGFQLFRCAFPQLGDATPSNVYFRAIARLRKGDFVDTLGSVDETEWMRDLAGQIWCNSRILSIKFAALKHAFVATLIALVPWAVTLSLTSKG
nr:Pycsar system effector family protein [uncultured Sphingomonas sp.]